MPDKKKYQGLKMNKKKCLGSSQPSEKKKMQNLGFTRGLSEEVIHQNRHSVDVQKIQKRDFCWMKT